MIIYKKDSKDKIRFLKVFAEGAFLVQQSGVVGTLNPIERRSERKGKNIGRSNETTPEEQAVLEAEAKIRNKISEGYFYTAGEAEDSNVILPMLAKPMGKFQPGWAQPKLDGMRSLGDCNKPTLTSRKGNPIETLDHIVKSLPLGNAILDGELYAHGKNFQQNMRLIKKYRPGETENVKYHVYDMIPDNEPNMAFIDRYKLLIAIVGDNPEIEVVQTVWIETQKELDDYHAQNLLKGYEGTMMRVGNCIYKVNGRSSELLKYKNFLDAAVAIYDIVPGDKNPEHGYPLFKWPGAMHAKYGADILGAGVKLSHDEREQLLINRNQNIGKMAELRFFEFSENGVPRFPVMVGIRLDK